MLCAWQAKAFHVLMCGDGGNDVGALKQADVGLALLSGYGNSNTVSPVTIRYEAQASCLPTGSEKGCLVTLKNGKGWL